jgi:succinoglycan biosynthesis protein ExoO
MEETEQNNRSTSTPASDRPDVSFAVACYNAGEFLAPAVESALAQTDVSIEVIIVDDGSSDGSFERAQDMARQDPRIRVLKTPKNGGPGAARNIALETMRGDWYAILDSDDLIDPARSRTLIDAAVESGADLIADDLIVFGEGIEPHSLISAELGEDACWIDIQAYVQRSCLFSGKPGFGYLKPMIKRAFLTEPPLRYNENLRIGEDDELIVRLLDQEAKYRLLPKGMYRYRKHGNSISHNLSVENATRMVEAERRLQDQIDPEVVHSRAYQDRYASMRRGLAFVTSIDQIKARKFGAALITLARSPSAIPLYKMPIKAALSRKFKKAD